jgi:hypothetical protein
MHHHWMMPICLWPQLDAAKASSVAALLPLATTGCCQSPPLLWLIPVFGHKWMLPKPPALMLVFGHNWMLPKRMS